MSDFGAVLICCAIMAGGIFSAHQKTPDVKEAARIQATAIERAAYVQADAIDRYVRVQERLVQIQLRIAVSNEEATEILAERARKAAP